MRRGNRRQQQGTSHRVNIRVKNGGEEGSRASRTTVTRSLLPQQRLEHPWPHTASIPLPYPRPLSSKRNSSFHSLISKTMYFVATTDHLRKGNWRSKRVFNYRAHTEQQIKSIGFFKVLGRPGFV